MADKFVGFQGTVDEVQWATLMAGIGQKYTLIAGDPVRASGRVVSIDPRAQIGCGVLFEHDAVKTVTVPTPATGQWHLLVARRVWSSRTVSYVLVAGNVTADTAQTAPPATLPAARNKTVGLTDDEPIAWVHARASVTTLNIWQMSVKRDGRAPGLWALFDPHEQGIYRAFSEADSGERFWNGSAWVGAGGNTSPIPLRIGVAASGFAGPSVTVSGGVATVVGRINNGNGLTLTASFQQIGVLPAGARPSGSVIAPATNAGTPTGVVQIQASGDISVAGNAAVTFAFSYPVVN